jgi:hypothetical protein
MYFNNLSVIMRNIQITATYIRAFLISSTDYKIVAFEISCIGVHVNYTMLVPFSLFKVALISIYPVGCSFSLSTLFEKKWPPGCYTPSYLTAPYCFLDQLKS